MESKSILAVAVFICSSDSPWDVLERVLPVLVHRWPDCPYPIYVGVNSNFGGVPHVNGLLAHRSEWRREATDQLRQVCESHVIVVLDDYLFQRKVDQKRLSSLVAEALQRDLPYLRLLPLGRSLAERLRLVTRVRQPGGIEPIALGRPFYSSMQISLWEKQHLLAMLEAPGSIWDFEHRQKSGVYHYSIRDSGPFVYRHLVERGHWLPHAGKLLAEAGVSSDLGARKVWPLWIWTKLLLDEIRFRVLGYGIH